MRPTFAAAALTGAMTWSRISKGSWWSEIGTHIGRATDASVNGSDGIDERSLSTLVIIPPIAVAVIIAFGCGTVLLHRSTDERGDGDCDHRGGKGKEGKRVH